MKIVPEVPRERLQPPASTVPVQPVERAKAVAARDLVGKFLREGDIFALTRVNLKSIEPLIELSDLFPQRHAREQVFRACLGGKPCVLIKFHIIEAGSS